MSVPPSPVLISWLSFDSTLLSPFFIFCEVLLLFLSFFCLLAHSPDCFLQKSLQYFSLGDGHFCMAPVWQLGEESWTVVCAACCHMTLVFAVMHLYNIFSFLLLLSIFLYF